MEHLEDFIRKNRKNLDRYDPPESAWNRIRTGLPASKRPFISGWSSAAAIALLIFGSAVLYHATNRNKTGADNLSRTEQRIFNSDPVLKETEIYYNSVINNLYREAQPLLTGHPDLEKELRADISQIDSICLDIRKDLRDNVANQEVIEALINNYRIKIRILEELLNALNEEPLQTEKNGNHAI
jgi:hypothetical protein